MRCFRNGAKTFVLFIVTMQHVLPDLFLPFGGIFSQFYCCFVVYFIFACDKSESELGILDLIQVNA